MALPLFSNETHTATPRLEARAWLDGYGPGVPSASRRARARAVWRLPVSQTSGWRSRLHPALQRAGRVNSTVQSHGDVSNSCRRRRRPLTPSRGSSFSAAYSAPPSPARPLPRGLWRGRRRRLHAPRRDTRHPPQRSARRTTLVRRWLRLTSGRAQRARAPRARLVRARGRRLPHASCLPRRSSTMAASRRTHHE